MAGLLQTNVSLKNISVEQYELHSSCQMSPSVQHQNVLIPTIYSIICILGVLGNGLVVFVLSHSSSRKTVANTYILNLALSDLLFVLSLPFWAVYYSFDYDWIFGKLMCKLCGGLLTLNLYASIFFITCMSIDRYMAIVHPLKAQRCRNVCRARVVSFIVWFAAGLASVPTLIFRDTLAIGDVNACVIQFLSPSWFVGFALMKNILGFLLPFAIITSCYCSIGKHLLTAPGLDKSTSNLDKVLKMVGAVVLAFFFCWFPFHMLTFLDVLVSLKVLQLCSVSNIISLGMPFTICLGFSNSAINPFLYCFVGNHFREQLGGLTQTLSLGSSQKRGSFSTRLSSFTRKLSDLRDLSPLENEAV
ncbi:type-2 angiotensin II receptor-like [Trichomycterus rosablanca]|uniref:type-2 angiotensin II receptor-like n=1 Tax=Trichomycterus rosablanca TaxID=2290929 RepID=UPI002F35D6B0